MNLSEIRQAVRDQVEQDETDLPNDRLDGYIREGYERVIQMETRWPFFEQLWTASVAAEQVSFAIPSDAAIIVAIVTPDCRLRFVETRDGEDWFGFEPTSGTVYQWSKLGTSIYLWPPPQSAVDMTLRGFRRPIDWIAAGAGTEVDADERLHWPIVNYALSRVYMQQEDDILSAIYLNDFREGVALARQAVMRPWRDETLVLGGRVSVPQLPDYGRLALVVDVDAGGP